MNLRLFGPTSHCFTLHAALLQAEWLRVWIPARQLMFWCWFTAGPAYFSRTNTQVAHVCTMCCILPTSNYILHHLTPILDPQTDRSRDTFYFNNKHVLRVWWSSGLENKPQVSWRNISGQMWSMESAVGFMASAEQINRENTSQQQGSIQCIFQTCSQSKNCSKQSLCPQICGLKSSSSWPQSNCVI